jgi:cation diffusion facilitator CzcD-associated flavoprotein CzcO
MDDYQGKVFHTARWDYNYTGGSPASPELTGLEGKTVALIGTGATAVQALPEIAKYAKEVYVIQRTPSSVDIRGNHDTDPAEWKTKIAPKKGWQRERHLNFCAFIHNAESKPEVNMVDDYWSKSFGYCALIGTPRDVTMEGVAGYVGELHAMDYARAQRVRRRAEEIVEDPQTAKVSSRAF